MALSDQFFLDLEAMAESLRAKGANLTAEDIMSVFLGESGVNPAARNVQGYAGLNGMGPNERRAAGFTGTIDDWTKLSAEEQLPYVQRYIDSDVRAFAGGDYSKLSGPGRLYLLNFTPAYVTKPDDFVIARKGSSIYDQNQGIDTDHKGWIQVDDMNKWLALRLNQSASLWSSLKARLASVVPNAAGASSAAVPLLLAAAAAGGAWWLLYRGGWETAARFFRSISGGRFA
jgi:hypothetical protein